MQDGGKLTVAAQRKLIREQTVSRAEGKFLSTGAAASTSAASLRGTMVCTLVCCVCIRRLGVCSSKRSHSRAVRHQIERYYTELFSCDTMNRPMEDQYVHMHSNRLCVVGVAASHPVMADEIEQIEFSSAVLESKVSGKKKKGGHFLLPTTILCHIKCKSGQVYALRRYAARTRVSETKWDEWVALTALLVVCAAAFAER